MKVEYVTSLGWSKEKVCCEFDRKKPEYRTFLRGCKHQELAHFLMANKNVFSPMVIL